MRRAYIPKADGTRRPLGIPTFKDKVVPRAIARVLEAVCEQDFLPCSYGFRPERSAHRALRQLHGVAAHAVGACRCGPQVLVPCVFTLDYAVTGR